MDESLPRPDGWSRSLRVFFRFGFCFFVLVLFPFPMGDAPGSVIHTTFYSRMWFALADRFGTRFLHAPPTPERFSEYMLADTAAGWTTLLLCVLLAMAAAVVWAILDRKRTEYRRLHGWLRLYVRFALGFTMLEYGMDKVLLLQFNWSLPGPRRLAQPFGTLSAFGLMWSFMGYSAGYTIFAGAGEVIGGVLLLFRRTATLGALIIAGVMANVVALNFCYQVPVKLFSSLLLLCGVFLIAPDTKRLLDFFVLNRATAPAIPASEPVRGWEARARMAADLLVVAFALYYFTFHAMKKYRERGVDRKSELYGLYQVEEFTQSGSRPAFDDSNWRRIAFDSNWQMIVFEMDDSMHYYESEVEPRKRTIKISGEYGGTADGAKDPPTNTLSYSWPDPAHLELHGDFNGQPLSIRLRRLELEKFTLVEHGFQWCENGGYYR